jgi:hypothetical protein
VCVVCWKLSGISCGSAFPVSVFRSHCAAYSNGTSASGADGSTKTQMHAVIAVCKTMPGRLAMQVAIFVGYLHCGFLGEWASG